MKFTSPELPGIVLDIAPETLKKVGVPLPEVALDAQPEEKSDEPVPFPIDERQQAIEIERVETIRAILYAQICKANNRTNEMTHVGAQHCDAELIGKLTELYMEISGAAQ